MKISLLFFSFHVSLPISLCIFSLYNNGASSLEKEKKGTDWVQCFSVLDPLRCGYVIKIWHVSWSQRVQCTNNGSSVPVYWTRCDADTWPKLNTCRDRSGFSTPNSSPKKKSSSSSNVFLHYSPCIIMGAN